MFKRVQSLLVYGLKQAQIQIHPRICDFYDAISYEVSHIGYDIQIALLGVKFRLILEADGQYKHLILGVHR